MAIPVLTEEQRKAALEKAMETRRERARLLAEVSDGTMTVREFIERNDKVTNRTKVKQLLTHVQGIGPKTAEKALFELKISKEARVKGLGEKQRQRLYDYLDNR